MRATHFSDDIKELNLSYLMLAQQLVQQDRETALFRLGIGEDVADIIENLSPAQILRMATSDMLLCRFRFDNTMMVGLLKQEERDTHAAQIHATILAAAQPVEHLA